MPISLAIKKEMVKKENILKQEAPQYPTEHLTILADQIFQLKVMN